MTTIPASPRVVRVIPDVAPLTREFDYLVPPALASDVRVGTLVRVNLHGRRVGGWVSAVDVVPPDGVTLRPISKVTGYGPSPALMGLAEWAARRWAGPRPSLLRSASPEHSVRALPPPSPPAPAGHGGGDDGLTSEALAARRCILRLPPAADLLPVVAAAAALGSALVVTPSSGLAEELRTRLRAEGVSGAVVPLEWAQAAAGAAVVLGARGAAWAPCPGLAAVVVLDGYEESLQQESAPTWNAWVVAAERARRAGVPCVVVTSCPTAELLAWPGARVLTPSRDRERSGWAPLEVVDRHRDDPRTGLYSPRLVALVRSGRRVVCVLNRKGRVRLLACAACSELVRCERCGATVSLSEGTLACARCLTVRPEVCLACGSMRMKALRVGVSRAREDLERLAGQPVGEVTSETATLPEDAIVVGTEAVLRRLHDVDAVAFLDFDQELLAPRYRAAEEALGLLALASRLVGGRTRSGRVMVQTRLPAHEVLVSALTADPSRMAASEARLRRDLGLPPAKAVALVSGVGAPEFVDSLRDVEILGPDRDRWLVKAADHRALSDALALASRPTGKRLRVEVDPLRL